jgi:pyridoxamine 5'-phosphate oxidase-like protein
MVDFGSDLGVRARERLTTEQVIWLTTVAPRRAPHPRPVWFLWDGGVFLIYSQPIAKKLAHIARNPEVALHFNSTPDLRQHPLQPISSRLCSPPLHRRSLMEQAALSPFAAWESFYVVIGSSSAVLIGLQFVVITLSAEINAPGVGSAVGAFSTPTIVHFCAVLLIAAILCAPWPGRSSAAIALGVCGVAGLAYALLVVRRARRQTIYVPVLEDWIWYNVLPLIAYAALLVAAVLLQRYPAPSLFVMGGTALLLLFVGIHNAWDTVTYIVLRRQRPEGDGDQN